MVPIEFNCRIITPMFIGNATKKEVELRPPAVKAAIRFWWRAMHGNLSLPELKNRESKIFGCGGNKAVKSKIRIITQDLTLVEAVDLPSKGFSRKINKTTPQEEISGVNTLKYLAFGTTGRKYYTPESTFTITIYTPDEFRQEIIYALKMCSAFGGLGAKSRNGYGRFTIENTSDDENDFIKRFVEGGENNFTSFDRQDYTSLSKETVLFKLNKIFTNWEGVLDELAYIYICGRVQFVDNKGKNFDGIEEEHDLKLRPFIAYPLKDSKIEFKNNFNSKITVKIDRHAKTHFFGIVKNENDYQGYILHLPYNYLNGEYTGIDYEDLLEKYNSVMLDFNTALLKTNLHKVTL